jgi:hypothetical protein
MVREAHRRHVSTTRAMRGASRASSRCPFGRSAKETNVAAKISAHMKHDISTTKVCPTRGKRCGVESCLRCCSPPGPPK